MKPISNPPNPWASDHVEWLGEPPAAELVVYEQMARSILSKNDSPDIPFRYGINIYRGCFHGCAYCYARPTHQYLDFGAGTDFESKIVVKLNAPELLEAAFMKPAWKGETICMSGNTDAYQPLEATYGLARRCLEVCVRFRNPVVIITKGSLVRRDIDLLAQLAAHDAAIVHVSIPFLDEKVARAVEPGTSSIVQRLKTIRMLSEAGVETGVSVSPIIPGLNDSCIPEILERAADAGARRAFMTLLRLPREVAPVFEERLRAEFPDRADKVMNAIREMRGGKVNRSGFGERMTGEGARWEAIRSLFKLHCQRHGFVVGERHDRRKESPFRRPNAQTSLF
jgi:DNA repair photolyase